MTNIDNLRDNELLYVLNILDTEELVNTCSSSNRLKTLCQSNNVLRDKIQRYLSIKEESRRLDRLDLEGLIEKYIKQKDIIKIKFLFDLMKRKYKRIDVLLLYNVMKSCDINLISMATDYYNINSIIKGLYGPMLMINDDCLLSIFSYLSENNKFDIHYNDDSLLTDASIKRPRIVRYLLDHGANFNNGKALKKAVDHNNIEIAKMLLQEGANPNEIYNVGRITTTLLSLMIRLDRLNMIRLLFQYGADPHLNNNEAIKSARKSNNEEIRDLFRDYL